MKNSYLSKGIWFLIGIILIGITAVILGYESGSDSTLLIFIFTSIPTIIFLICMIYSFVKYSRIKKFIKTSYQCGAVVEKIESCHRLGNWYEFAIHVRFQDHNGVMRNGVTDYCFSAKKANQIQEKKLIVIYYKDNITKVIIS